MKKSSDNSKRRYPKEIERVIEPQPYEITDDAKITFDGRQFIVRIPKRISRLIGIEKGDALEFHVIKPHPKAQNVELQFDVKLKKGG
jgi:hypothetical protein